MVSQSLHSPKSSGSSLKAHEGLTSPSYSEKITADRISAFCRSVGITNERSTPPTFLTLFRQGEFDLLKQIGVDLANVLHAEQEYEYVDDIRADDQVFYRSKLETVLEKQTAEVLMAFMTFQTNIDAETTAHDGMSARRTIGTASSVIVVREKRSK